jgi:monovalent cation/hydrogen antiporter
VTAGIYLGWHTPELTNAETRLQALAFWTILVFLVNAALFTLIGLQLPSVLDGLDAWSTRELVTAAVAVCATVVFVRLAWVLFFTYLQRKRLRMRNATVVAWAGMRGAVSLAAALAIPLQTDAGAPFPARELLSFLAFCVILVTLIGQGLTLPWLIRALKVEDDGSLEHEEMHARRAATDAALVRIEEMRTEVPGHLPLLDQLKERYDHREEHLVHDHGDGLAGTMPDELTPEQVEEMEHDEIRRSVISAERLAILELRDRGEITDDTLRRIERDLDLDELRREA